jgi:hypothetical protein
VIALSLVTDLWIDLLILGDGHLVCETSVAPQLLDGGVANAAQHLYNTTNLSSKLPKLQSLRPNTPQPISQI